jgi:hypothetical protein
MLFSERIRQLREELLTLWIAEQIIEVVEDEKRVGRQGGEYSKNTIIDNRFNDK